MTNRNVGTRRVSRKQLDILWEYLHTHRDIAVSYNRSLQAKEYSKRKWQNIADVLNAQGDGAHKDWKSWSKYWVDYKAKMKKRVAALRSSQQRTGGGPSIEQPLSDIENKFLQILGNDYGQGLSGVQVEPFPPSVSTIPEMEIESPVIDSQVLDPNITNSETSESILRGPPNPIQTLVQEPTCHPPDEPSSSRSPPPCLPTPTASVLSPRRRRRRREVPISHEVARRALVQSSESRAQAALHSNQTLQAINHTLIEIKDAIKELCSIHQRIERADGKPPARTKLQVALCYIVTGVSYRYLQAFYRISRAAISLLIPEVMQAIYTYLENYLKVPKNNEEWKEVESGFRTRWNFPGCHGAIDGKHVTIEAPPNSGSEYFNYKGSNSVVLMAVVDHDYCFRYVNIGANGRNSDAGIFKNSRLRNDLESNLLPKGGFFVGDDAFPLKTYLLKPYNGRNLTEKQKNFNYRLSRARRIVENAFGILASRFRIFHKPIPSDVSTTEKIIRASCALHNWLRLTSTSHYFPRGCVDEEDVNSGNIIEGTWRRELISGLPSITDHNSNYASRTARQLRENYADFFSGIGAVSWQNRMIS